MGRGRRRERYWNTESKTGMNRVGKRERAIVGGKERAVMRRQKEKSEGEGCQTRGRQCNQPVAHPRG